MVNWHQNGGPGQTTLFPKSALPFCYTYFKRYDEVMIAYGAAGILVVILDLQKCQAYGKWPPNWNFI